MVDQKDMERRLGKIHWLTLRDGDQMSWGRIFGRTGIEIFSFDGGKTAYAVFGYGKIELTPEQLDIFKKEAPIMADLYLAGKKDTPQAVMDEATSMGYADATYYGEQDGIMYYKLVPKEDETPIDTLFLSQDKDGKIETVNKMVMRGLFPMRYDLRELP